MSKFGNLSKRSTILGPRKDSTELKEIIQESDEDDDFTIYFDVHSLL